MAISGASGPAMPGSSGSNIDVNGIVNKLMDVERRPLAAIDTKEASYQSKISAFGKVKSELSAFQTALHGLDSNTKFLANNATTSDPSSFTVSAKNSASIGHHTIDIENLAQAQRLAAPGISSETDHIGKGNLTFELGTVSEGQFVPNMGKYRASTLTGAEIANRTVPGTPGTTISLADTTTLAPDANSTGTIPAGTLTINGIAVDKIQLLDADSPLHRAQNIADAFDAAYVESGGNAGTFTAVNGKVVIKSDTGGKAITFGIAGKAQDSVAAAKELETLSLQTGLSVEQLGTQEHGNSLVTVASTMGLSVGDPISGNGFPEGTKIASIVDTTHFLTTDAGDEGKGVTLNTSSASGAKTIAIDDSNDTLQGIRDAINSAKIGITASIVNDGTSAPYRLLLEADTPGANSNIKITVGGGDAALTRLLSQNPVGSQNLSEIVAPKDASLVIDGIKVTKPKNVIDDVIPGVTITLLKPTGITGAIDVTRDMASVKSSVEDFVKHYNELKKTITDLTAYNAATKKGAVLQGDSAMRSLDSQIDSILTIPLKGPMGSMTTLSQAGITRQTDGSLAIDTAKFNTVLGSHYDEVAGLFAAIGKTSDEKINFRAASQLTVPGTYSVSVTDFGVQGSSVGRKNLNMGSIQIEKDSTANVDIDGVKASVSLTAGLYSATQLATMLQNAINNNSEFSVKGKAVTAHIDDQGALNIVSNTYGSNSSVSLTDGKGTSVSDFMGSATNTMGKDASGMIDGVPAKGKGQTLTSTSGPSNGIQVQIAGGELGARGAVSYTEGYAHKLNEFINRALGSDGILTGRIDGLGTTVRGLSKERDNINSRLTSVEDRYRRQYTKLDAMLGKMNETRTYLSQELAKL